MTGIQPDALLADEGLYAASVEQAERAEWTSLHEAVASVAELVHWLIRVTYRANGAKPDDVPKAFRYPRPGDEPDEPLRVRPGDLARMLRGR